MTILIQIYLLSKVYEIAAEDSVCQRFDTSDQLMSTIKDMQMFAFAQKHLSK